MFCIHCGNELPEHAGFCPSCGKAQRADAATPAPVVVTKPALSRGALVAIVAAVLALPALGFLGIIAAIAIPAYQDYTQRAKVANALTQVAPVKAAYAEYLLSEGELPASLADLNVTLTPEPPMRTLTLSDGLLVIEFDGDVLDGTLALEPWLSNHGNGVQWLCGHADEVSGAADASALTEANASDYTSINSKWLPSSCR